MYYSFFLGPDECLHKLPSGAGCVGGHWHAVDSTLAFWGMDSYYLTGESCGLDTTIPYEALGLMHLSTSPLESDSLNLTV